MVGDTPDKMDWFRRPVFEALHMNMDKGLKPLLKPRLKHRLLFVLPNKGHEAIAKIIKSKDNGHCVTQNVDNLHQAAGLEDDQVTEIHGNATYAVCLKCEKKFELELIHQAFKENQKPPTCEDCKGFIKTATISFGQPMPEKEMMRAQNEAANCDLMIAVGSSLVVYPAATIPLLGKQSGAKFVILNNESTEMDQFADLVINASISDTFDAIL